eukprot:14320-Chlamydomonas_euryale.AAC.2
MDWNAPAILLKLTNNPQPLIGLPTACAASCVDAPETSSPVLTLKQQKQNLKKSPEKSESQKATRVPDRGKIAVIHERLLNPNPRGSVGSGSTPSYA